MTKIVSADLGAVDSFVNGALGSEGADTAKLVAAINDFVSGAKGVLSGTAWEKEIAALEQYLPALQKRQELASSIMAASSAANGVMSAYVGGEAVIDDVKLQELYQEQTNINNTIASIKSKKSKNVNDEISGLYGTLAEIDKQIKKLEKLVPTDAAAYSHYQNLDTSISNLASSIR